MFPEIFGALRFRYFRLEEASKIGDVQNVDLTLNGSTSVSFASLSHNSEVSSIDRLKLTVTDTAPHISSAIIHVGQDCRIGSINRVTYKGDSTFLSISGANAVRQIGNFSLRLTRDLSYGSLIFLQSAEGIY